MSNNTIYFFEYVVEDIKIATDVDLITKLFLMGHNEILLHFHNSRYLVLFYFALTSALSLSTVSKLQTQKYHTSLIRRMLPLVYFYQRLEAA